MAQRTGGPRRKTRNKYQKSVREKGKIKIRNYLQKFEVGDKVALIADSSYQRGLSHPRFYGRVGVINGMQGVCYKVGLVDGKLAKTFIVHPVHLKRIYNE